jgi:hypothetical protein
MRFYLLWHDRSHHSEECRWFREQIMEIIRKRINLKPAPRAQDYPERSAPLAMA